MLTLPNLLLVLLVQDNNQKVPNKGEPIAYCALAVNVGGFNDPPHRNGLAHFLEHMIFMGSEKYPEEDAFSAHISENGGDCNAFTQYEKTVFTFDVCYSGLEKAFDMLAQNFSKPFLHPEAVDREIKAIESEYQMCIPDDSVRIIQTLQANCAQKDHIFNRFLWGNK